MRTAVYLRQSLDVSGEQLAVTRQREDCLGIASARGWQVVEEYVDNSISASDRTKVRPSYDRMVRDFKAGKFEALVCWDLDRLTRQPRQLEDWIEAAEERGLLLVTANGEADLGTDAGRLFARIKAAVARGEIERKGARQRRAQQQAAEQGRPAGGRRAFGYSSDGSTQIESEAELVRAAYADFLAGASLKGIARRWNELGVTTTAGNPWRHDNLREVLKNPRYAGLRTYRGEVVGPATWEPIIDRETLDAVRGLLALPERRTTASLARKWLLPGLAYCQCGSDVATGHTRHGKRVYVCRAAKHVSRAADPVDAFIAGGTLDRVLIDGVTQRDVTTHGVVVERMARPDVAGLLVDRRGPDVSADRARAQAIRERLDDLTVGLEEGLLTLESVRASGRRLRDELVEVQARIDAAVTVDVLAPLASAAGLEATAQVWASYDLLQRREVIDTLMTITLLSPKAGRQAFDPATVIVDWK